MEELMKETKAGQTVPTSETEPKKKFGLPKSKKAKKWMKTVSYTHLEGVCAGKTGRFHCAIEIISFLGGNPKNFRPHGNHAEPVGYHTRQVVILGRVSGSAQAFSMGGRRCV